ncbi:hypothetical protein PybrP1_011661 [[Pythium] brassicae (nom. inval.)]|nr:hypothetical protein PybrP1_011661 [[Pythium] brassicae (nom. inval.)]
MAPPGAPPPPPPPKQKLLRRLLLAIGGFVGKRLLSLCWLTYALGLAWLLAHPAVTVSTGEAKPRGTYISENALLVDSFEPRSSHRETQAAREFQRELAALPLVGERGCGERCEHVLAWLETRLRALDRVEAHRHVFRTPGALETRTNVYGILRAAPLADGKYSGVALALALLEYLVDAKWLAKDVAQGELPMRAGVIRAAVNLETLGRASDAGVMGVFTAGINGQLPNLDLVNTAVLALHGEHIPVALDRRTGDGNARLLAWLRRVAVDALVPVAHRAAVREYLSNLSGMLRFMTTLATGPSGAHAHFIRYNIDSVTLSALPGGGGDRATTTALSLRATLRAVEKLVRALSNLEEKLHQSFFLYVLPNTRHFVSVGEYYYVVALAVSPALAHLAVLASRTVGMRLAFSVVALLLVEAGALAALVTAPTVFASPGRRGALRGWGFVLAVAAAQGAFVGIALPRLRALALLSGCAERRDWRVRVRTYEERHKGDDKKSDDNGGGGGGGVAAPAPVALKPNEIRAIIPQQDTGWRGLKFVVMILLVYAHCVLGILNYPMALFCAVPTSLFALVEPLGATQSAVKRWRSALWLLASSPLVLFATGLWLCGDAFLASLAYAADSFALGTNQLTLPYACCLYLPVHTLSLGIWLYPTATEAADDDAQDASAKKTN